MSLNLLLPLLLMQFRMHLAFWAANAHHLVTLCFSATNTPKPFSSVFLSILCIDCTSAWDCSSLCAGPCMWPCCTSRCSHRSTAQACAISSLLSLKEGISFLKIIDCTALGIITHSEASLSHTVHAMTKMLNSPSPNTEPEQRCLFIENFW